MTPVTDWPDQLTVNENHIVVRNGYTWFSYTAKGDAIQFHLFSLEPKFLNIRCDQFINWVFDSHEWCKMLIITIAGKMSLVRLAKRHGFSVIEAVDDNYLMARPRRWDL